MSPFQMRVIADLNELRSHDINVPDKAFELAKEDLSEYENMSVSECSDMLIHLGLNT